jgi:hypothetical protein
MITLLFTQTALALELHTGRTRQFGQRAAKILYPRG